MAAPVGYTRRARIVAFHSHSCPPLRTRYTQRARKNDSASCARFACCTPRSTSCQRNSALSAPSPRVSGLLGGAYERRCAKLFEVLLEWQQGVRLVWHPLHLTGREQPHASEACDAPP